MILFVLFLSVQIEDAETQTEEMSFTTFKSVINDVMDHDEVTMVTHDASSFNVIEEEVEIEGMTIEHPGHTSQEQETEMNTAL